MQQAHRSTRTRTARTPRGLRAAAALLIASGAVCLAAATAASAVTVNATATIASPGSLAALASGGSTTQFTVTLPANAACSGDTANHGYHVYSYLVRKGTNLASLKFINDPPTGDYGFVDTTGTYYGPANTAIGTGQIVQIPNDFEWAPLVATDGVPLTTLLGGASDGVWEAGLLCANTTGAVTDNWNTQITFTASSTDPNGFVWADVPGAGTTTTTTTTAGASTTTTTTAASATTTDASSDSSTTTTTTPAAVAGSAGGGGAAGTDGSSGSGDTGTGSSEATGGNLAFTGFPVWKGIGAGLLAIGVGLMLLGWGYESRKRTDRAVSRSPW
ncbi:MAG: hypothetical protein ACLQPH_06130 [Acidimicrobiales bacterium]